MSEGNYDDLIILEKHMEIVKQRIKVLVSNVSRVDAASQLFASPDGQKLQRLLQTKSEAISKNPNLIPREQLNLIDNFVKNPMNYLFDVDYIIQVLCGISDTFKKLKDKNVEYDLGFGIKLTIHFCNLFSSYIKTCLTLANIGQQLYTIYAYSRFSSYNQKLTNQLKMAAKLQEFLENITVDPLTFPLKELAFLENQVHSLVRKLAPVCTSLFASFSTFNWSQFYIECDDFLGESTDDLLPQHYIMKYSNVFVTFLRFYILVFPSYLTLHPEHTNLLFSFLSESDSIHLYDLNDLKPNENSITINDILKLCKSHKLPPSFSNIKTETETKSKITHPKRIKHLKNLLSEILEHYEICKETVLLYTDEILALIGFAYYEIDTCLKNTQLNKLLIDLLEIVVEFFHIFEEESQIMKRTFVFNLARQDYEYLGNLFSILASRPIETDQLVSFAHATQSIFSSLEHLDLEECDKGVSYDFTPLLLTHGRLLISVYQNSLINSITTPILNHMMTIVRHSRLASNPLQTIYDVFPINNIHNLEKAFSNLKQSSPITHLRTYVNLFRYTPNSKISDNAFERSTTSYIDKLVSSFSDMVKVQSVQTMIIRQSEYDPGFKADAFIPTFTPDVPESYKTQTTIINRLTNVIEAVSTMPLYVIHGNIQKDMLNIFKNKLIEKIIEKFKDNEPNPLIYISIINVMLQTLQNVFNTIDTPLVPFVLRSLKLQFSKFGTSTLHDKTDILFSSNPLKLDGYVDFFRTELGNFIDNNYIRSVYEPFGLRFVGDQSTKHPFDLMFAQVPIGDLLQTFGYDAAIASIHEINKHLIDSIKYLHRTFSVLKSQIVSWMSNYQQNHQFPHEVLENSTIKEASRHLLRMGVANVLYGMIKNSARSLTSALLPGFVDATQAALVRLTTNIQPEDALVAEMIGVSQTNYFLTEQVKKIINQETDIVPFFFYLSLLFSNPDWDHISFHEDNDSFTSNVQLLIVGFGIILDLKDVLFNTTEDILENAEDLFFTTLASIVDYKKSIDPESYDPFLILIDHFPYFIPKIGYGILENAFPFTIIRAAYSKISAEPECIKAVMRSDENYIQKVLPKTPKDIETKNSFGSTPLIVAAREGNTKIFKMLLEKGANVNAKNNQGDTALHVALDTNHNDIAQLLIEKNVDVNARGSHNQTPLQKAHSDDIIKLLRAKGAK